MILIWSDKKMMLMMEEICCCLRETGWLQSWINRKKRWRDAILPMRWTVFRFLRWVPTTFQRTIFWHDKTGHARIYCFYLRRSPILIRCVYGVAVIFWMISFMIFVTKEVFWFGMTLCLRAHPMNFQIILRKMYQLRFVRMWEDCALMRALRYGAETMS